MEEHPGNNPDAGKEKAKRARRRHQGTSATSATGSRSCAWTIRAPELAIGAVRMAQCLAGAFRSKAKRRTSRSDPEKLAATLDPNVGCALNLTAGRRRFRLQGPWLREVVSKLVAIDPDGAQLAPGRAVQTGIHHVPVLMLARGGLPRHSRPPQLRAERGEWIEDACLDFLELD